MNRITKQIVYGLFYGAIWFFLIYGGYSLTVQAPPSCIDAVQNRDETGIDCGGSYCQSCEVKQLEPIRFGAVKTLSSGGGKGTTAIVEIRNPNAAYGTPKLSYAVLFYGTSNDLLYQETGDAPVYPAEVKYRLVVNAPVAFSSVARVEATTTAPYAWQKITDLARPKMPVRGVVMEYNATTKRAVVAGIVKNDNPFTIHRVTLSALVYDNEGRLAGVSKTFAQDLVAAEERFFKIDVPISEEVDSAQLADPKVSVDAER